MGVIIPYQFISKGNQKILLRSPTPLDAKAVLHLSYNVISENDTLVTTVEEFLVTEEMQKDYIQMYSNDPRNCMIVAECNKKIIGLLTFQGGTLQKYSHHGTIGMIVDQKFRGFGIGRSLLLAFIQWADYNPLLEKVCLEVLASNTNAISLYKSLGFIEEGRQRKQVKIGNGMYEDLIIMGKFLDYEWRS